MLQKTSKIFNINIFDDRTRDLINNIIYPENFIDREKKAPEDPIRNFTNDCDI